MKKILFSLLALASPFLVTAQHGWARPYWEIGIIGGVSNYSGELVNTIVDVKHMHLAGGLFVRYNFNKYLTFRAQAAYGSISGDDKDSKDDRNVLRNLHFRSPLLEFGVMGEFNLMGYNPVGHGKMFSPYAFLGISVFNFNPKAQHFDPNRDGEWVKLQPIHTEGQGLSNFPNREPYKMTQVSIPMGLGFKFAVHSNLNIGFEIGFRKTFTDHLDDVANTYAYDQIDPLQQPFPESLYDKTPYNDGVYNLVNNDGTVFRSLSYQEMMADGTFLLLMQQSGTTNVIIDDYIQAVGNRGGYKERGAKGLDSYLIAGLTISYNFTDEGLAGARQRRKRRAGCKSAQF